MCCTDNFIRSSETKTFCERNELCVHNWLRFGSWVTFHQHFIGGNFFLIHFESTLRLTIALKCHDLGLFVVAGCLNPESDGAKKLNQLHNNNRMVVIPVDIRDNNSIEEAQNRVDELIAENGLSNN